jgi:hypothetical protein
VAVAVTGDTRHLLRCLARRCGAPDIAGAPEHLIKFGFELRAYQRRTLAANAPIAGCATSPAPTPVVCAALGALFGGAVGEDKVSRVWRKVKSDWEAWNARSLADEPIVRLILDGTVGMACKNSRARSRRPASTGSNQLSKSSAVASVSTCGSKAS